jgi:hypothetical protein
MCVAGAAVCSPAALGEDLQPRDKVGYRGGLISVTAPGEKPVSNSGYLVGLFEYSRVFRGRYELRLGTRILRNSEINRLQVVEAQTGVRFFPWSYSYDPAGPMGNWSLKWSFPFKPYVESQLAVGRFVADVLGRPAVLDFSSSYLGLGVGLGVNYALTDFLEIGTGVNEQLGFSVGPVTVNPNILHVFVGVNFIF